MARVQGALNDGSYGYDTQESVVKYEAKINGSKAPWKSNPWCWVVSFKRVRS